MDDLTCFRCGEPGHLRANCRAARVPRPREQPAPVPASAVPAMRVKDPALTRRPASEIAADVHRCAEQARRGLAAAGCIVDAAEHRAARLRALAAAQLAEATQQQDPTLWRTAAAILKGK